MNNKIVKNYTFNAVAKTVTSTDFTSIEIILSILNVTTGDIIYLPNNPNKGGTLSNGVLTLDYNTTSMSNTDKLQIIIENTVTNFKWYFSKVIASGVDTDFGTVIKTGTGQTISQSAGNLVVTTGTTAYSESIIRSNQPFDPNGIVRWGLQLSQRIANQNFSVEFVDVIGDNLSMTINSTTSVTVTKTAHGFTSADIGKGMWIGNISVASCLTQRATIASVTTDTITFTVVGFPASGTGTCSLFGYNFYQVIYSGTNANALGSFATQRLGWQNLIPSPTIYSSTSPGHIGIIDCPRHNDASLNDQINTTSTSNQIAQRATSNQNIPENTPLYLQIRVFNGTAAPASTTTLTMCFVDAQMYDPQMISVAGIQSISGKNSLPVYFPATPSVAVSGTVTANGGTPVTPTAYTLNSAATTNAVAVKASAGTVYAVAVTNTSAAVKYLKIYNKATAPTVGTDVPLITIPIAPTAIANITWADKGLRFATGIGIATTTGIAYTDTTAVAANDLQITISYI